MKRIILFFAITLCLCGIDAFGQTNSSWKYKGKYIQHDIRFGHDDEKNLTIYDDKIVCHYKVGSDMTLPYIGMKDGWRVYYKEFGKRTSQYYYTIEVRVNDNYDIRWFDTGQEFPTRKEGSGTVSSVGSGSGYNGGYNSGYNGGTSVSPGSTGNSRDIPQQPEKKRRYCGVCHGTGSCNICNGTGKHIAMGFGKDGPCPSCPNHSGRCSACNGRGEWYE